MTTTVTINAHCDNRTTKVRVVITDIASKTEEFSMENGESVDCAVYDAREISIKEVPTLTLRNKPTDQEASTESGNNQGDPPKDLDSLDV